MATVNLKIGSTVIECDVSLAGQVDFAIYRSTDGSYYAEDPIQSSTNRPTPTQAVAIALSEGHNGETAVMRAIAIRAQGTLSADGRAALEAAKLHESAARENLRAAQIQSAIQKRRMGGA